MAGKEKNFKYKALMIEKGVNEPCPFLNCQETNRPAFHFGFIAIDNAENFIPGHKKRARINAKDDIVDCAYCGLSMYKTEDGARNKWWKVLNKRQREMLKYTHLLKGDLKKELGVMSIDAGEHFTFFEYEGVELSDHFEILGSL